MSSLMARKRRGRRKYNLRRVRFSSELGLGTLASDTAVTAAVFGAGDSAYRMVSIKGTYSARNLTTDEGPLTFGWAHSDYSVQEIKETLEAVSAIAQGDKIANERANRLVRVVGALMSGTGGTKVMNDGNPVKTRLNWLISVGDSVVFFVFNEDTGSLTTGATFNMQGDAYIKDV